MYVCDCVLVCFTNEVRFLILLALNTSCLSLVNIAWRKTTRASSSPGVQSTCGDNVVANSFNRYNAGNGECCVLANVVGASWWYVDLDNVYTVNYVEVTGRDDCCG